METNTDSQIHKICFMNHSDMFRLPQRKHHQAAQNHKKKIIYFKVYDSVQPDGEVAEACSCEP